MKKIIAFVLVLSTVAVFASCASHNSADDTINEYAHYFDDSVVFTASGDADRIFPYADKFETVMEAVMADGRKVTKYVLNGAIFDCEQGENALGKPTLTTGSVTVGGHTVSVPKFTYDADKGDRFGAFTAEVSGLGKAVVVWFRSGNAGFGRTLVFDSDGNQLTEAASEDKQNSDTAVLFYNDNGKLAFIAAPNKYYESVISSDRAEMITEYCADLEEPKKQSGTMLYDKYLKYNVTDSLSQTAPDDFASDEDAYLKLFSENREKYGLWRCVNGTDGVGETEYSLHSGIYTLGADCVVCKLENLISDGRNDSGIAMASLLKEIAACRDFLGSVGSIAFTRDGAILVSFGIEYDNATDRCGISSVLSGGSTELLPDPIFGEQEITVFVTNQTTGR